MLRSLAARSASASGWAALGGHAGLHGPRLRGGHPPSRHALTTLQPRGVLPRSSSPRGAREEEKCGSGRTRRGSCGCATCPPLKERTPRALNGRAACLITPPGNSPRVSAYVGNIGAICHLRRPCPTALHSGRSRAARGGRSACASLASLGSRFALRGIVLQSWNTYINQAPLSHASPPAPLRA